MTLEQIQNLTVENAFFALLTRLVDFSTVPQDEELYTLSEDQQASLYDRITLHASLTKPALSAFDSELVAYKAELTAAENARLAEVARIDGLKARWKVIQDRDGGHPAFFSLIPGESNPLAYLRDAILKEPDHALAESRLAALETKDSELIAAEAAVAWQNERAKKYKKDADPLFMEAVREKLNGDDTKWTAYMAIINAIKAAHPKPV